MSDSSMGRRFERLLLLAGPLAVASVLVLFVAVASEDQDERKRAKCLRSVAEVLSLNLDGLDQASQGKKAVIQGQVAESYWSALRFALIPWEVRNTGCVQYFPAFSIKDKVAAPKILIEKALKEVDGLDQKPLSLYGIEVPERATINLFGTPIAMSSSTLARVMQVVLAPLLLLWLGSLYNTRHRESLLIGRMKDVSALYPHLINVYPVVLRGNTAWDPPRKKSWSKYVLLVFGMPTIYALIRIALLLIFVGPPVAFYWLSIFLVGETSYSPFFLGMGVVVFLFTMATLICELLPWHVSKKFSVVTRSPI